MFYDKLSLHVLVFETIYQIFFWFSCSKVFVLVCNFDSVNQLIIDRLPMTKHFGRSFSILLHFE
jgi:hypothetical protein